MVSLVFKLYKLILYLVFKVCAQRNILTLLAINTGIHSPISILQL